MSTLIVSLPDGIPMDDDEIVFNIIRRNSNSRMIIFVPHNDGGIDIVTHIPTEYDLVKSVVLIAEEINSKEINSMISTYRDTSNESEYWFFEN